MLAAVNVETWWKVVHPAQAPSSLYCWLGPQCNLGQFWVVVISRIFHSGTDLGIILDVS